MSEQLLLINPRRRRRRARRRNPKRKRASRRRMPAALRRYWATHRRGRKRTRLANPRRRRRHRNPKHRHWGRVHAHKRRTNPRRRHVMRRYRRRRSNPLGGINNIVRDALIPGAIGAAGAAALDFGMGIISPNLPATFQTAPFNTLIQIAGAIGLGMGAEKVLGKQKGEYVMLGGLVVVGYNFLKGMLGSSGISLPGLAGYADYTPYKLGAYLAPGTTPATAGFGNRRGNIGRLGYVSPAAVVGPTLSPQMGAYLRPADMNVMNSLGDYGDGM